MADTLKHTTSGTLFSPEQVSDVFNKVSGHSAIAALSGQKPIPFAGVDSYIFTMDGEASIVAEGGQKPAGDAGFSKVNVKPIKVVYQHRLTDEFMNMADEVALPYLEQFYDGFSKKIARALDIMAFKGLNPATKAASTEIGENYFDSKITQKVAYDAANGDDNIDEAVATIQEGDGVANGIAMSPAVASDLGKIKDKTGSKVSLYPEFRFGGKPKAFGGMNLDINNTVSFNASSEKSAENTVAYIGDFQNAMKWGYTQDIETEIIEFGDPDGQGDLKRTNEIVIRAEAYIGWGIIDPSSFVRLVKANPSA